METLSSIFEALADGLMKVLPKSPFPEFLAEIGELPYLGYLNWFFPVGSCIKVMAAWLTAIGLFYLYSIAMRWIRAIGG